MYAVIQFVEAYGLWVAFFAVLLDQGGLPIPSYGVVIVTAAIQSIPRELYEAVSIDGGGWRAKLRYVTWPHLVPTLGSTALTLGILYLTLITLLIVLTGGGPLGATTTLAFEVFRGTVQAVNIGPTAVFSIAILLANVALGVLYMRLTGRVTA